ncbi:hypothetical protein ACJQWK_01594 [Exserohilum turcicum]
MIQAASTIAIVHPHVHLLYIHRCRVARPGPHPSPLSSAAVCRLAQHTASPTILSSLLLLAGATAHFRVLCMFPQTLFHVLVRHAMRVHGHGRSRSVTAMAAIAVLPLRREHVPAAKRSGRAPALHCDTVLPMAADAPDRMSPGTVNRLLPVLSSRACNGAVEQSKAAIKARQATS